MMVAVVVSVLLHLALLAFLDELPSVREPSPNRPIEIQVTLRREPEPREAARVAAPPPATRPKRAPSKPVSTPEASPPPAPTAMETKALPERALEPVRPVWKRGGETFPQGASSLSEAPDVPVPEESLSFRSPPVPLAGNPRPDYPRSARRFGWEGTVVLTVEVLPDGASGRIEIEESSGYRELDRAALAAARKWRFAPALEGGHAVAAEVEIPFVFILK